MHTLFDVRGNLLVFIDITDGKTHDVNTLDKIEIERDAFYIMDKGYTDFERLYKIHFALAFFVIRAKENLRLRRISSNSIDKKTGLRCDQTIKLIGPKSSKLYPQVLRRVKYYDIENKQTLVFLTNNFNIEANEVALLYKYRW
jgi:hypothetical protein